MAIIVPIAEPVAVDRTHPTMKVTRGNKWPGKLIEIHNQRRPSISPELVNIFATIPARKRARIIMASTSFAIPLTIASAQSFGFLAKTNARKTPQSAGIQKAIGSACPVNARTQMPAAITRNGNTIPAAPNLNSSFFLKISTIYLR
jgi:hypothetical protein